MKRKRPKMRKTKKKLFPIHTEQEIFDQAAKFGSPVLNMITALERSYFKKGQVDFDREEFINPHPIEDDPIAQDVRIFIDQFYNKGKCDPREKNPIRFYLGEDHAPLPPAIRSPHLEQVGSWKSGGGLFPFPFTSPGARNLSSGQEQPDPQHEAKITHEWDCPIGPIKTIVIGPQPDTIFDKIFRAESRRMAEAIDAQFVLEALCSEDDLSKMDLTREDFEKALRLVKKAADDNLIGPTKEEIMKRLNERTVEFRQEIFGEFYTSGS